MSLIRQVHAITVNLDEADIWRRAAAASARCKHAHLRLKSQRLAKAKLALDSHDPSIHVGAVASGSLVIVDDGKKRQLLRLHGKLLGTEMEGAGVMHAVFFNADAPKSAIVIKGISDAANKDKASLDTLHVWRELASENAARLALAVIKRGRLQPTLADQFNLDVTVASAAEARAVITTPTAANVVFLAFPRLVRPKGPMTSLEITARLMSNGAGVAALEARMTYSRKGQRVEERLEPGSPVRYRTNDPLDAEPIGLYLLAACDPDSMIIDVKGGGSEKSGHVKL